MTIYFQKRQEQPQIPTGKAAPTAATAIDPTATFGSPRAFGNPAAPSNRFFVAKDAIDSNRQTPAPAQG